MVETRSTFLWMAIFFTLILLFFRVQNHKIVWVFWEDSLRGVIFAAVAVFLWAVFPDSETQGPRAASRQVSLDGDLLLSSAFSIHGQRSQNYMALEQGP